MPLFTFDCVDCNEHFEQLVSLNQDLKDIRCPGCDSENLMKKMSRVARSFRPSSSQVQISGPSCSPGGT